MLIPLAHRAVIAVIAVAHDSGLDAGPCDSFYFTERLRTLLMSSAEDAFYVGGLPLIFARNEPILLERSESYRLAALVFANTVLLELMELFYEVRIDGYCLAPDDGETDRLAAVSATGVSGGGEGAHKRGQPSAANVPKAHEGANVAPVFEPPAPPEPLLVSYVNNADGVHKGLIGVQSVLVSTLLIGFQYAHHWRSHAVSLIINYALLYLCVIFRQRHVARPA